MVPKAKIQSLLRLPNPSTLLVILNEPLHALFQSYHHQHHLMPISRERTRTFFKRRKAEPSSSLDELVVTGWFTELAICFRRIELFGVHERALGLMRR